MTHQKDTYNQINWNNSRAVFPAKRAINHLLLEIKMHEKTEW